MSKRLCLGCKKSITRLHRNTKRCRKCYQKNKIIYNRELCRKIKAKEKEKNGPRICKDCKTCIENTHPVTKRCEDCALEAKRKREKLYKDEKRYTPRKIPKEKICKICETCIAHRDPTSKYCEECAAKQIIINKPLHRKTFLKKKRKIARLEEEPKHCFICEIYIPHVRQSTRYCKKCAAKIQKENLKKRRKDPEYRVTEAAKDKKRRDIIMSTPEGREKIKITKQKCYLKIMSTPEGREKQRSKRYKYYVSTVRSRQKRQERRQEPLGLPPIPNKQELFDLQGGRCGLTGALMHGIPFEDLHIDHIIPISKGGRTIPKNVCLAIGIANMSKGNKLLRVWKTSSLYKLMVKRCMERDF